MRIFAGTTRRRPIRRRATRYLVHGAEGLLGVLAMLVAVTPVHAQSKQDSVLARREHSIPRGIPQTALVLGLRETHVEIVIPKDPVLAAILSVGFPGMGQIYTGNWQRGLAFMGGMTASLVAVGLAADQLPLTVEDYDAPGRGGNGDGVLDIAEYLAWEDNPQGDFGELSTVRKAVIGAGLGAALGLYVWNAVDAYVQANNHNRGIYSALTDMQVSVGVDRNGRTQARLSLPL